MTTDNTETTEENALEAEGDSVQLVVMPKESEWNYGKPPNEIEVEVELGGQIIAVEAYYGRDGYLPHWRANGGDKCWGVEKFKRWRYSA